MGTSGLLLGVVALAVCISAMPPGEIDFIQLDQDANGLEEFAPGNFTGVIGFHPNGTEQQWNNTLITPTPTPTIDPMLEYYQTWVHNETCSYFYDLAEMLKPLFYPDEPIRENLLLSSEAIGCWVEGMGANYQRDDLYKPVRGDKGPFPTSGYPYVIHALIADKRNIPIHIKYDDPLVTGQDLMKLVADQLGMKMGMFTIYRNGHPITPSTKLSTLGLKFQDAVTVDFDMSIYKKDEDGHAIQGRFFAKTGDSQLSLHGIAP